MKKLVPLLLLLIGLGIGFLLGRGSGIAPGTAPGDAPGEAVEVPPPGSAEPARPAALPAELHTKHARYGLPVGTDPTNDLIIRDAYALSSNDATRFADWVAYRVDAESIANEEPTSRRWRADPWLADEETLEPADYKGAYESLDVDRGHQAPLAALRGTGAWEETNFLSNITPQKSALNQGPWRMLEERVRGLVGTYEAVYVVTGTLYERAMPSLPGADEPHRVPSGYWKVVVAGEEPAAVRAAAFVMDQETPRGAAVLDFLRSVDDVERRSGLDVLSALPDDVEAALEARVDTSWAQAYFGER